MKALQSPTTFAREAHDRAEHCAEQAEDAEFTAMIAWAHMREAQQRLRAREKDARQAVALADGTLKVCALRSPSAEHS